MSEYNYKVSYEPICPESRMTLSGKTAFAIGVGLFAASGVAEKGILEVAGTFIGTGSVAYFAYDSFVEPILNLVDGDKPCIVSIEDILKRANNNQAIVPK